MRPLFHPLCRLRRIPRLQGPPASKGVQRHWSFWSAAVAFCVALATPVPRTVAAQPEPDKKLIEYGWDAPTPAQMRDQLAGMEDPFELYL